MIIKILTVIFIIFIVLIETYNTNYIKSYIKIKKCELMTPNNIFYSNPFNLTKNVQKCYNQCSDKLCKINCELNSTQMQKSFNYQYGIFGDAFNKFC